MSVFASCFDLLDIPARSATCPGCGTHAPAWTRVTVDELRVLTHDGDVICPRDRDFGSAFAPAPVRLEVAA